MEFREFMQAAQQRARTPSPEQTLSALSAFFLTLAERLQARDALMISSALPPELANLVLSPPRAHGEMFSADEFVHRIASREKTDDYRARKHAAAIGGVLAERLSARSRQRLSQMLDRDFQAFFLIDEDKTS